jgi:hypothetical protein
VSQSFSGWEATQVSQQPPANGTASLYLDVENMNLRLDTETLYNVCGQYTDLSSVKVSVIVSVATKRITIFYDTRIITPCTSHTPAGMNCTYWVIDDMPSVDFVRNFTEQALHQQQVTRDSDTGFNKFEFTLDPSILPLPDASGNFVVTVSMDDDSVLRKLEVDGELSMPQIMQKCGLICQIASAFMSRHATAGPPDTTDPFHSPHFTVPPEWGHCHEGSIPRSGNLALERFETLLMRIGQHLQM